MKFSRKASVDNAAIRAVILTLKRSAPRAKKSTVAHPQPIDGDEHDVTPVRMLAVIDENNCIGCTKCIQACPVDAIVGATRAMHTVMSDLCTGCNLCVDPCPTQCIELRPVAETPDSWKWDLNTIPVRIIPVEQHV